MVDPSYDFATFEKSGRLRLKRKSIPLRSQIQTVLRSLAPERGEDFAVNVPDDLIVNADDAALDKIVANLVVNALRYGKPPITISATRRDDQVSINVRDCGRGVSSEFVPLLFRPFTRSEISATEVAEGSGLGLALSQLYALAHGGELVYEGDESGASFTLVFPHSIAQRMPSTRYAEATKTAEWSDTNAARSAGQAEISVALTSIA